MKYESKSFDQIIKEEGVSNHDFNLKLESGVVLLPENILSRFKQLYRPHGTRKSDGNGEVALYWLLGEKYGGSYKVKHQKVNGKADLKVENWQVEVKGWNQDIFSNQRIKVGRFESLHDIRQMINIIFGAYNVFAAGNYSGDKHGKNSYLSESSFGMNGLTRAFDCALRIRDINFDHINNVRKVLSNPIYDGLKTPEDFAAKTFMYLSKVKLQHKVGRGNFIINVRPDIMGRIEILKLGNLEEVNLEEIKRGGARVQCAELFVNLRIFGERKT